MSFKWTDIGDIAKGRPNIGVKMHVAVYRMFQYSLRSVLESKYGEYEVRLDLVEAGRAAGMEFCKNMIGTDLLPDSFLDKLKNAIEDLGIGIMRIEHADFDNMIFIFTVSEDLDCSGLPVTGEAVCSFDEGLIMGILEMYTDRRFMVKETDCWSTGAQTCRFHISAI